MMIAGLIATKPGRAPRLFYRIRLRRSRKGERKLFSQADYAALLDAVHQQLGGPIVVVWEHPRQRQDACTDRGPLLADDHPAVRLCSRVQPGRGGLDSAGAFTGQLGQKTLDELARLVEARLKRKQYRPQLISGFIAKIRLDFKP